MIRRSVSAKKADLHCTALLSGVNAATNIFPLMLELLVSYECVEQCANIAIAITFDLD